MKFLLCSVLLGGVLLLQGCALFGGGSKRKPKSSARIYEGDAPSITMTEEQSAGGTLRPYGRSSR